VEGEEIPERSALPKVVSCVSGEETLIRNFVKIADYLRREPLHLRKFLLKRLATAEVLKAES
jgi:translation initiation factor 2 subunit 2